MDTSLLNIDFEPLTEVKAKLSEKVAQVEGGNRLLAITLNGKPKAVLMPYAELLRWIRKMAPAAKEPDWTLSEWEKTSRQRRKTSESIKNLFDISVLKRKGQKPYKSDALKKFKKS